MTAGVAEAHSTGASVTSSHTATDDWAAGSTDSSSIGASMGGRTDAQIGQKLGDANVKMVQNSKNISAGGKAGGQLGLEVFGTGADVGVQAGAQTSKTWAQTDQSLAEKSFAHGVGIDQSAQKRDEVGSSLRYGKSEASSQGRSESQDRRETAQTGRQYSQGTSESRTDSQDETKTETETTGKQISRQWDAIKVSNQIARDPELLDDLTRAVIDTGISHEVENFMLKNHQKLSNTFAGPDAENAKYAMSAMYVMQGMTGNPYSGDNAQERMNVLNAMGDEILLKTGFSSVNSAAANVSMDEFRASSAADPSQIDTLYGRVSSGVGLEKETVEDALAYMPTSGDPKKAVIDLFDRMGGRADEITEGQGNAILSTARERLDLEFGPIQADAMSFLDTRRELGWKGAVQDLYRDNQAVRDSDVYRSYSDNKSGGWFSEDKGAPAMMDDRMQQLSASGLTTTDNDVARFMVASQFYAGATNAGDTEMASAFDQQRQDIIARNPGFAAGDTEERLTALAMLGTNNTTMQSSILRGQQEAMIGGLEHELESVSGRDLNSLGNNVSWGGAGGSSHDPASFVGGLLGFIRNHEAPDGYSDYWGGSRVAPERPLETMTINEVREWQRDTLREQANRGVPYDSRSSAAGGYQIISGTLDRLVDQMGLTGNETFDARMQDSMAVHLLNGRGLADYQNGHISLEQFGNNVALEWASMPTLSGAGAGQSAYAGVGSNRALTSSDDYRVALARG